MSGTRTGGQRASQTNKSLYGENFYSVIGKSGGLKKVPKGFALMDAQKHSQASAKGGVISRRGKIN